MTDTGGTTESVDTLVIGGGQAGLASSYWLAKAGIDHLVVDGRDRLGGSWPDRWDSFHLVAPNFTLQLPGMAYDGPDPDGFMARDQVVATPGAEAVLRLRAVIANGDFDDYWQWHQQQEQRRNHLDHYQQLDLAA